MMVAWLLQAIAYAILSLGVVAVNWHRPQTRLIGAALLAFSLATSATFFSTMAFEGRLLMEMLLVTGVGTLISYSWFTGDAHRPFQIAILLCVIDIALCGSLCLHGSTALHARSLFGWSTNIVFVGLCACVAAPGVRDGYVAWIADIDRVRRMDGSAPDMDWAIRTLERTPDR